MREITMNSGAGRSFKEVFEEFVISKTAQGVSEATLDNYHYHMKNISHYLDTERDFDDIKKKDIEIMAVAMRKAGIKHNSIATYLRMLKTFYNWCREENLSSIIVPTFNEKETVKETYTDEELKCLLKRPDSDCSFSEFRNWTIVNFLLNSGCRAATVRNIQNKDVDLEAMHVTFRHNKNGKIQVIPLCSLMVNILRSYMRIRRGKPAEYLFCDIYGGMLTENALRHAIAHYNKSRGVSSTSIHKFRHTFARKYLVDCGGNAFTLQKLMGHSTLNMTKHYCRVFDADIAKDYDMFSPLAQLQKPKERIAKKK